MKNLINFMYDGMIFSAQPRKCKDEMASVEHPGQNNMLARIK